MSSPFVGEIRIVGFSYAPKGWATCDGQLIAIPQNTALFSLIGTSFGGNGTSNFGLPNFQGRVPIHQGQGNGLSPYVIGESGGLSAVTLDQTTTPTHTHNPFFGDEEPALDPSPQADLYAGAGTQIYGVPGTKTFAPKAVQILGNSQPHDNMAPYVTLLYTIALYGVYPARN